MNSLNIFMYCILVYGSKQIFVNRNIDTVMILRTKDCKIYSVGKTYWEKIHEATENMGDPKNKKIPQGESRLDLFTDVKHYQETPACELDLRAYFVNKEGKKLNCFSAYMKFSDDKNKEDFIIFLKDLLEFDLNPTNKHHFRLFKEQVDQPKYHLNVSKSDYIGALVACDLPFFLNFGVSEHFSCVNGTPEGIYLTDCYTSTCGSRFPKIILLMKTNLSVEIFLLESDSNSDILY